jgi:hypothetical protein
MASIGVEHKLALADAIARLRKAAAGLGVLAV